MTLSICPERVRPVSEVELAGSDSTRAGPELVDELLDGFRALRPAEALLEYTEAAVLARLKESEGVRRLGFVSISVMAEELLGLRPRTTSERLRLARVLTRFPRAKRLFLDGRVTTCQLLAVAPMLESNDADLWLDRATRCSVRVLRAMVRLARRGEPAEDEEEGRVVSFNAPVPFLSVWNSSLESARRTLGHDGPVHRAVEAILNENGMSGTGEPASAERPPVRKPTPIRRLPPRFVRPHPDALARARGILADLKEVLAQLPLTVAQKETRDPFLLLKQLRVVRCLRNPLEHLRARILLALRTLNAIERCGYRRFDAFVEAELDLSGRTARHWIAEAHLYEDRPDLAGACSRGEIGSVSALMIRSLPSFDEEAWVGRAQQVTVRQLVREVRFHVHLRQIDSRIASRFRCAFPHSGIEEAITEKLCADHGWTVKSIEEFLKGQGLDPIDPEASDDPAENPIRQRRLELLLEMLAAEAWEQSPEPETALDEEVRQTSARESTVTIRFWAPEPIAADWEAAIQEIRRKQGDRRLPIWAAAVILLHAAVKEWGKTDPEATPVKSRILKRDGWRCAMPGCRVRRNLESHHVRFRSLGGRDTIANQITLCATHHRHVVHNGWASVRGSAAQGLRWTLGNRRNGPPVLELRGDRIVSMNGRPNEAVAASHGGEKNRERFESAAIVSSLRRCEPDQVLRVCSQPGASPDAGHP